MRIVTILGSPRKKGNTAAVLGQFESLMAPSHQVERINIADYRVEGCLGCDACQKILRQAPPLDSRWLLFYYSR